MIYYETKVYDYIENMGNHDALAKLFSEGWEVVDKVADRKKAGVVWHYSLRRELPWEYDFFQYETGGDYHDYGKDINIALQCGWDILHENTTGNESLIMLRRNMPEDMQKKLGRPCCE